MPIGSRNYLIDELERYQFFYDKGYAKRFGLCTCPEFGYACIRKLDIWEIDIPTPCTPHFEWWLGDKGFIPIEKGNTFHKRKLFKKYPLFWKIRYILSYTINKIIFKFYFWFMDKFLKYQLAPLMKASKDLVKKKDGHYTGTIYSDFMPMTKKFKPFEYTKPYEYSPKFNQRNLILGKVVEFPIGSYDKVPCKKCGANFTSQH